MKPMRPMRPMKPMKPIKPRKRHQYLLWSLLVALLGGSPLVAQTTGKLHYGFSDVFVVETQTYLDSQARYFRVIAPNGTPGELLPGGSAWPAEAPFPLPPTVTDILVVQWNPALLDQFNTQVESCERMAIVAQADSTSRVFRLFFNKLKIEHLTQSGNQLIVSVGSAQMRCDLARD